MSIDNISYEYCDGDALPAESTNISSFDPNQFYKVCPGLHRHSNGTYASLGQPRCGDGTNYSFLVSRPKEQQQQQQQEQEQPREKILIELSGGGACWDDTTCKLQSMFGFLSYPKWNDLIVGTSCSDYDDFLCSKTVAGVDFSTYNFVFIPYCTQDVHLGDEPNASYDDGKSTIQHVGAHNIYRTLQWVFDNFPNPSDIFLTGCSAGGTPMPVIYDLVNSHYNNNAMSGVGDQVVNIDVIADSPVYLTPPYFVENILQNWNFGTIMEKIGFDFERYKNQESFPDELLGYTLDRSNKGTDKFGMVTHDADQVSIRYYTMMRGGSLSDLFGRERLLSSAGTSPLDKLSTRSNLNQRMISDIKSEWWNELNNSMSLAKSEHSNFDMFVMEGDGHCSFGLNVPLEYSGFEDWASSSIMQESSISTLNSPTNTSLLSPTDPSAMASTPSTNMAAKQASSSFAIAATILLSWRFLSFFAH